MECVRVVDKPFFTVQGEGSRVGAPSVFTRLAGCDLRCPWCDTPGSLPDYLPLDRRFTLEPAGPRVRDISVEQLLEEVHAELAAHPGADLVITGGEPTLQPEALSRLIQLGYEKLASITVETNFQRLDGLRNFSHASDLISASPKVAASSPAAVEDLLENVALHSRVGRRVQAKIVVASVADLDPALRLLSRFRRRDCWAAMSIEASWLRSGWLPRDERPALLHKLAEMGALLVAQMHPVLKMA